MFDAMQIKARNKIEDEDFKRRLDYARYLLTQTLNRSRKSPQTVVGKAKGLWQPFFKSKSV